jgi:transcriptional regulator with XRE-family HTH domain
MDTLASRMRSARHAKGLSQAQLAKLVKCGQTTIASIENGRNQGSTVLARVADVLGVAALWLAEGRGPQEFRPAPYSAQPSLVVAMRAESKNGGYSVEDSAIAEVVRLMQETDPNGRQLALGAVRGALANHQHPNEKSRCAVIVLADYRSMMVPGPQHRSE